MRIGVLALCFAALLVGCSDDDKPYSATVEYPSKTDTWSSMLAGVLEVGGTIDGTRSAGGSVRNVRFKLTFGGSGLNCAPKITLRADAGSRSAETKLEPPQAALEVPAVVTFPAAVEGSIRLRITLDESDCGPIGIAVGASTVTFES